MTSSRPTLLPLLRSSVFVSRPLLRRYVHPAPLHQLYLSPVARPARPNPHTLRLYSSAPPPEPKSYNYKEIASISTSPSPKRILIDVREPSELQQTGRIPGAVNMPLTSNPDAFYLSEEDFRERFGFEKPKGISGRSAVEMRQGGKGGATQRSPYTPKMKQREASSGINSEDGEVDGLEANEEASMSGKGEEEEGDGGVEEVIFYCKAGVRSRAAARMAREWEGVKAGHFPEGWMGWEGNGGESER